MINSKLVVFDKFHFVIAFNSAWQYDAYRCKNKINFILTNIKIYIVSYFYELFMFVYCRMRTLETGGVLG